MWRAGSRISCVAEVAHRTDDSIVMYPRRLRDVCGVEGCNDRLTVVGGDRYTVIGSREQETSALSCPLNDNLPL